MNYEAQKEKVAKLRKELYEAMKELRQYESDNDIYFEENKQDVADAFCYLLQMTRSGGCANFVKEMKYEIDSKHDETVTPILANGNDEWYKAYVTDDSGTAMIIDITNQFVRKAW